MLGDLPDQRLAVALGHPVPRLDPLVGVDGGLELCLEASWRPLVDGGHRFAPPNRMFVRSMMAHGARHAQEWSAGRQAGGMIPSETMRTMSAGSRSEPGRPGRYHSMTELTVPDRSRAASAGSTPRRICAVLHRLGHKRGDRRVERPSSSQGPPLDIGVAPHPQQQRHVRQFGGEDLHLAPDDVTQAVQRPALLRRRLLQDPEQAVQRTLQRSAEKLLLAADVVVERRLGDAGRAGEVLHAGRVVATGVELGDGDGEQRLGVVDRRRVPAVPRTGGATGGAGSPVRARAATRPSGAARRPVVN